MVELRVGSSPRANLGLPFPTALPLLAWCTVVVARGLSHSLPGTFAGIDWQIRWVGIAADVLTQLCALTFGVVLVRMLVRVLASARDITTKVLAAFATGATVSVVYVSTGAAFHPAPWWLLAMGGGVAILGVWVVQSALRNKQQRGPGLILAFVMLAGVIHLGARWVLVQGESRPGARLFAWTQGFATAGFVAELLATIAMFVWLLTGPPRDRVLWARRVGLEPAVLFRSLAALGIALATALAIAPGAAGWRLLFSRTLVALGTHPDPLVPLWASSLVDLLVFLAVGLCVLPWARSRQARAAVALALLGRASFDVPLGALFVLSGLVALVLDDGRRPIRA